MEIFCSLLCAETFAKWLPPLITLENQAQSTQKRCMWTPPAAVSLSPPIPGRFNKLMESTYDTSVHLSTIQPKHKLGWDSKTFYCRKGVISKLSLLCDSIHMTFSERQSYGSGEGISNFQGFGLRGDVITRERYERIWG